MNVVAYLRVSTMEQAHGFAAQRIAVLAAAEKLGSTINDIYEDRGVSGSLSLEDRPNLLAAVNTLKRGDVLLVAKRDRIGRDVVAVALIERLVERKGARIISAAGEGTNSDDPTALLMRRIVDAFAEYERQVIRARTRAALQAKRARGERAGNLPFGYVVADDGQTLIPDPDEQETIRLAREIRSRGCSYRAVVATLRDRGRVGRTGRPLGLKQVFSIIKQSA